MTKQKQKPHIHVSAALIQKNGKVLIAKRDKKGDLPGYWEFPGGKQDKGESLQECLEREIKEELGLKIRAGHVFYTVDHEYDNKVISLHVMNCSILAGKPQAIECQDFKWIRPEDSQKFVFPPPDIKVIEFLSSHNLWGKEN